jgi:predicted dehydrogenase
MKTGIVGCGKVAHCHINPYLGIALEADRVKEPKAEVIAVADILEDKVEETADFYRQRGYSIKHKFSGKDAYRRLLDTGVDAVDVCVPPLEDKVRILKDAMKAGKHILAEKPLSYDAESAEEIVKAWSKKTVFAMSYNWRFTYIMNKMKELIATRRYGKLESISIVHVEPWNYSNRDSFYTRIGYLIEHNVHDINYIRYLNGEFKVTDAVAYGDKPRNPSSLSFEFEYEDGSKGSFHSMNGSRKSEMTVRCNFEKGLVVGIRSDNNQDFEWSSTPYFRIFAPDGELFAEPLFPIGDEDLKRQKISWLRVNGQGAGVGHAPIIEDFMASIREQRQPRSNVIDGHKDLLAAYDILGRI